MEKHLSVVSVCCFIQGMTKPHDEYDYQGMSLENTKMCGECLALLTTCMCLVLLSFYSPMLYVALDTKTLGTYLNNAFVCF